MNCSYTSNDVPTLGCLIPIIGRIVAAIFLFLGAVTLGFLLFGSIKFILSSGDPKAIASAKNTMTYAIFGLILILISFALLSFLATFLGLPADQFLTVGF